MLKLTLFYLFQDFPLVVQDLDRHRQRTKMFKMTPKYAFLLWHSIPFICIFYITLPFGGGKSFCLRCDSAFFQYMSNRKNKSSIQKMPRFCILSTQIHVLADVNLRFLRVIFYIQYILLNPQSGCEFQEQVGWGTRLLFPKYCLDRKKIYLKLSPLPPLH